MQHYSEKMKWTIDAHNDSMNESQKEIKKHKEARQRAHIALVHSCKIKLSLCLMTESRVLIPGDGRQSRESSKWEITQETLGQ